MEKLFSFQINEKLHEKIKIKAVPEKKSMTQIVNEKLKELFLDDKEKPKEQ